MKIKKCKDVFFIPNFCCEVKPQFSVTTLNYHSDCFKNRFWKFFTKEKRYFTKYNVYNLCFCKKSPIKIDNPQKKYNFFSEHIKYLKIINLKFFDIIIVKTLKTKRYDENFVYRI